MSKVLVFGTGGVGCIYAYICQKGGASVTAVCRSNFQAVKDHGITIDSKIFGKVKATPTPVRTVTEAVPLGPFDYILVCAKAFPGTSALIKDAVTPGTTSIVLAQNGIGIEQEYHDAYPSNTIISGVVYLPTTQTKPGYVEMGPLEIFEIGLFPRPISSSQAAENQGSIRKTLAFAEIFTAAGATCVPYPDIQQRRWIKLAVNAAWNPLCALSLCDDANLLRSSPGAIEQVKESMREVGNIATAVGYPGLITEEEIERQTSRAMQRLDSGGKEPSMLTDVRSGRPMETESIIGNAIRIAKEFGVTVKALNLIYVLLKARDFSMNPDERWKDIA